MRRISALRRDAGALERNAPNTFVFPTISMVCVRVGLGATIPFFDGSSTFAASTSRNSFFPCFFFYICLEGLVKNSVARLHQASDPARYPKRDYFAFNKYASTHIACRA